MYNLTLFTTLAIGDAGLAAYCFGYGLHPMQDIYAHGNIWPQQHQFPPNTSKYWDDSSKKPSRYSDMQKKTRELITSFYKWTNKK